MTSYIPVIRGIPFLIIWLCVWFSLIVGPPAFLIWAIRRWWISSPRIIAPAWRSYLAIGATALVGLSNLLWLVFGIWLDVNGERSYESIFASLAAIGFIAALVGFLGSLLGKGSLRRPAYYLGIVMSILWVGMGAVS
jgi:hypothetical protein